MISKIVIWLKKYARENNIKAFVVGVSGGVDSAVVSTLCAETGYPTICVLMPIKQNPEHTGRGKRHIAWLESKWSTVMGRTIDLNSTYQQFKEAVAPDVTDMSLANSRARLRMTTLYNIAGAVNGLVVGTGNKVEDFGVGFYTKYGDGGVDISPIADLMKSEVYDLARQLQINREIIEAQPTDGLWDDGRTDEDQLGISYKELEWAMNFIEEDKDPSVLSEKGLKTLETFKYWNNLNKHKMVPIPVWKKE